MQSLALASIANIGGAEFAEALTPDVQVGPPHAVLVPLPNLPPPIAPLQCLSPL